MKKLEQWNEWGGKNEKEQKNKTEKQERKKDKLTYRYTVKDSFCQKKSGLKSSHTHSISLHMIQI